MCGWKIFTTTTNRKVNDLSIANTNFKYNNEDQSGRDIILKLFKWSKLPISLSESNVGNENFKLRNQHTTFSAHKYIAFPV